MVSTSHRRARRAIGPRARWFASAWWLTTLLGACGAGSAGTGAATGTSASHPADIERIPATAPAQLGMNDVSILLPLPHDLGAPVLATASGGSSELIPRNWFAALVTAHHDIAPKNGAAIALDDFHVVAIRVDLCDRQTVGPCPDRVPGRLRLVLQPLYRASIAEASSPATFAHDVALHAFYAIPADELADVIVELRGLAQLQAAPASAPLSVSPAAAAGNAAYLARLRALVMRYARPDNLVRLAVIGQQAGSVAFAWIFRGIDRIDQSQSGRSETSFAPLIIPGIDREQQSMLLAGGDTVYHADQIVDEPAGFALATNGARFAAAIQPARQAALEALTALQNPLLHDTGDTQCISCHVATFLTARRSAAAGLDPQKLPGRFTAPHPLTVDSVAGRDPRVVRAFGWAGPVPAISQRVANDTAEVLQEIEARFPAQPRR